MQTVTTLDDQRVANYRNLRERDLRSEGLFITEGSLLAERLLKSRYPVESLFVTAENASHFEDLLAGKAPLYVAEAALMRQIVGFDFHRGILGLGRRLPFGDVITTVETSANKASGLRLIACPDTETSENLGLILRSALAFEIDCVLLPEAGADPLSRRCLRQSMGSALSLPVARSQDLLRDLCTLQQSQNLHLVAAVADADFQDVIPLHRFIWPQRSVLLVGNEYSGLDKDWLERCHHRVTIPIAPGCDSLNVAVATGVLLFHMSCSGN